MVRELIVVFWGNELSLGIIFSSWLFWIACGSLFLGRFVDRLKDKLKAYISCQILFSLFLLPTVLGIKAIRALWNIPPGELIGPFPFLISVFLLLAPGCLILGFQFALACGLYAGEKARPDFRDTPMAAGRVYRLDALGDMLGGIAFACLLVNIFYSFKTLFTLAILNLSLALMTALLFLKKRTIAFFCFCLLIIFAAVLNTSLVDKLNSYAGRLEWKGMPLQAAAFSKYADYAVIKGAGSFYIYGNGQLLFSLPDEALAEEIIHLSFSQIRKPERILLIGGVLSGAVTQALKYSGLKEIIILEKDPGLIRLGQRYISSRERRSLAASGSRIVIGDGRWFVKNYQGENFDGIILNVINPLTAERNRFYTLEFFKEAKKILKPEGIFFLGIDSHENYLSPEMRKFNGCIYRTLKEVFPRIVLFPGSTLYLAASSQSGFLTDNPAILSRRLAGRRIFARYINEYTLPHRLSQERISYIRGILSSEEKESRRLNRDFHPISYYYNIILRGSKIFPQKAAQVFWRLSRMKIRSVAGGLILVSLVLIAWRRRLRKGFVPLAVSIGGMAGISLELILIIGFQIIYGNLYFMIGVIVASFMMGLVIGAGLITRSMGKFRNERLALGRIELALGIYALFVAFILLILARWRGVPFLISTRVLFPFLTILAGLWVGMIFPLANNICSAGRDRIGETAGRLYAFDLLGACFGALVTTVFLIPLFGLIQTCLLIGLVCGLGFAVLSVPN
ncbi:MAG: hypothetical protein U9Q24_00600 [Candidatus Ratteibacteria bacterium]|nr:hypothetical protein [Candidatus Ratteibacteria bacterium]